MKIYNEWYLPIKDYFKTIKKEEALFEIVFPLIISTIIVISYTFNGNINSAFLKLRDLYPTTLAILIGFTITCITVLISSNSNSIDTLKDTKTNGRFLGIENISLYKWLLLSFMYNLILQIAVLLSVFFFAYITSVIKLKIFYFIAIFFLVFLLLHVLFSLIRNISNLYFSFLNNK